MAGALRTLTVGLGMLIVVLTMSPVQGNYKQGEKNKHWRKGQDHVGGEVPD